MESPIRFFRKLWIFVRREKFNSELEEEMAFHREHAEKQLQVQGLPPQAAQHAARGTGVVILNKLNVQFDLVPECLRVPSFQEKAAFVSEYKRFQEQNIWNFCTNHLHGHSRRCLRGVVANSDHIHSSRAVRRALPVV